MINKLIFIVIILLNQSVLAQFKFNFNSSIPIINNNQNLSLAWAGGLNYPQFSAIDFDYDGDKDLFVFDRSENNIRLFENIETGNTRTYKEVQLAYKLFPADQISRTQLVDYNQDGKEDLFTYYLGGIKVYKNVGNQTIGLQWEEITDKIKSDYDGQISTLFVSSGDTPALSDIDNDGDIDILTFDVGGVLLEYHQNLSQETNGDSESLIFKLSNRCWGYFAEDAITSEIILNSSDPFCNELNVSNPKDGNQNPIRHAGSSLLAIDIDNSGVKDLLLGDINSSRIHLLINSGTEVNANSPIVEVVADYPTNTVPIDVTTFPSLFFIDVDFDGLKDLIAAPNARNSSENRKSVWYYKNIGTNEVPNFIFQKDNFLQENMIDVGSGAIPVFADVSGDGLNDLIVANHFNYKIPNEKESKLSYFINEGDLNNPSFRFVTDDFLDLSTLNLGLRTVPAFVDIDNDGDQDLYLGLQNGKVNFIPNVANPNAAFTAGTMQVELSDDLNQVITTQSYAFPTFYDFNQDGKQDLFLGKRSGEITYYENTGTLSNPVFTKITDTLAGVDVSPNAIDGHIAPFFLKENDTLFLFIGTSLGTIFHYFYDENLAEFIQLSDNFLGKISEGYTSVWIEDIDNNNKLNLFIGNDLGGVLSLEHDELSNLFLNENFQANKISIYPNPSSGTIKIDLEHVKQVKILDLHGKTLSLLNKLGNKSWEIPNKLSNGIYHLVIESQEAQFTSKLVLLTE